MSSKSEHNIKHYFGYLILAILIIVVDQLTKQIANSQLSSQSAVEVLPVFKLVLVFNYGAAFGFLNDAGGWQHWLFVSLAGFFSIVLVVWIWKEYRSNPGLSLGLALILGGAVGNLVDRLQVGYVIDFLLLHYENWYFPAFNIADVAITFGAIILILDSVFAAKNKETT